MPNIFIIRVDNLAYKLNALTHCMSKREKALSNHLSPLSEHLCISNLETGSFQDLFHSHPPPPPQRAAHRWVPFRISSYEDSHPKRSKNGQELGMDSTNWTTRTNPSEERRGHEKIAQRTNPITKRMEITATHLKYNRTNLIG